MKKDRIILIVAIIVNVFGIYLASLPVPQLPQNNTMKSM